jgi:hypothetical protein
MLMPPAISTSSSGSSHSSKNTLGRFDKHGKERGVIARIEDANRGIDMIQVDNQLPQRGAGVRNLAGVLGALLDKAGQGIRSLNGWSSALALGSERLPRNARGAAFGSFWRMPSTS